MGLSGIFFSSETLLAGIERAEIREPAIIEEEVLRVAIEALDYAKAYAPWADRTGDARAGLDTHVEWDGDIIVWQLYHTVEYGLWLETIQNGAFAIIMPTLESFAPRVGARLSEAGFDSGE